MVGSYPHHLHSTFCTFIVMLYYISEHSTGIGDIKILWHDNHPLKYHNYCKYHNIYLIGYNSAKSQAYSIKLYHTPVCQMFSDCMLCNLYDIDNNITIVVFQYQKFSFTSVVVALNIMASR